MKLSCISIAALVALASAQNASTPSAQNATQGTGWPKRLGKTGVDISKPFGLLPQAGAGFDNLAIVLIDGGLWLASSGDAAFALEKGVLKSTSGQGLRFDKGAQVVISNNATKKVSIDNGAIKVPGSGTALRLCPSEGGPPHKIFAGGNCTNGQNLTADVAPLVAGSSAADVANSAVVNIVSAGAVVAAFAALLI